MLVGENQVQLRARARIPSSRRSVIHEAIPIEVDSDVSHRAGQTGAYVENLEVRQAGAAHTVECRRSDVGMFAPDFAEALARRYGHVVRCSTAVFAVGADGHRSV